MTDETRQSPTEAVSHDIAVGDTFRDRYYDKHDSSKALRTIRVIKVGEAGIMARTATDCFGRIQANGRITRISFKTLRSGYEQLNTLQRPEGA